MGDLDVVDGAARSVSCMALEVRGPGEGCLRACRGVELVLVLQWQLHGVGGVAEMVVPAGILIGGVPAHAVTTAAACAGAAGYDATVEDLTAPDV